MSWWLTRVLTAFIFKLLVRLCLQQFLSLYLFFLDYYVSIYGCYTVCLSFKKTNFKYLASQCGRGRARARPFQRGLVRAALPVTHKWAVSLHELLYKALNLPNFTLFPELSQLARRARNRVIRFGGPPTTFKLVHVFDVKLWRSDSEIGAQTPARLPLNTARFWQEKLILLYPTMALSGVMLPSFSTFSNQREKPWENVSLKQCHAIVCMCFVCVCFFKYPWFWFCL